MIDMMMIILCWPSSPGEDYDYGNDYDYDEGQPGPSDDYEYEGLGRRHLSHRTCCTPVAWVPCMATALLHSCFLYLKQLFYSSSSLSLFSLCLYISKTIFFAFSFLSPFFSLSLYPKQRLSSSLSLFFSWSLFL